MKHRYLCLLLVLTMVFTCIPGGLFAEGDNSDPTEVVNEAPAPVEDKKDDTPAPAPVEDKKDETPTSNPVEDKKDDTPAPAPEEVKKDDTPASDPDEDNKKDDTPTTDPVEDKKDDTPTTDPVADKKDDTPVSDPDEDKKDDTPVSDPDEDKKDEEPATDPDEEQDAEEPASDPEEEQDDEEPASDPEEEQDEEESASDPEEEQDGEESEEAFKTGLVYLIEGSVFADEKLKETAGIVNKKAVVYAAARVTGEGALAKGDVIKVAANVEGEIHTYYVKAVRLTWLTDDEAAAYGKAQHSEGIEYNSVKLDPVNFTAAVEETTDSQEEDGVPKTDPEEEEDDSEPETDPEEVESDGKLKATPDQEDDKSETDPEEEEGDDESETDPEEEEGNDEPETDPEEEEGNDEPETDPEEEEGNDEPETDPEQEEGDDESETDPEEEEGDDESETDPEEVESDDESETDPEQEEGDDESETDPEEEEGNDESETDPEEEGEPAYKTWQATIVLQHQNSLAIRKTADANGKELFKAKKGDEVTVLSDDGTWAYISVAGREGYIMMKFLEKVEKALDNEVKEEEDGETETDPKKAEIEELEEEDVIEEIEEVIEVEVEDSAKGEVEEIVEIEETDEIVEVDSALAGIFEFTKNLEDTSAVVGEQVVFEVAADWAVSYRWQWSADATNWMTFTNNSPTFTFTMAERFAGRYYRCFVSNGTREIESNTAQLTLETDVTDVFVFTKNLEDTSAVVGEQVVFEVAADWAVSYRWQWSADGTNWMTFTNNSGTFTFTMAERFDGRYYRCFVSNGTKEIESNTAHLTLATDVFEFTKNLEDKSASVGEQVVFEVEADGAIAYRWQWSADGTNWMTFTNNSGTFTFTMAERFDGRYYRCFVSNGTKEIESNTAHLILSSIFTVDEVIYRILDNTSTVAIESYDGSASTLIIPTHPKEGYTVVRVGPSAFENNSLISSISLPNTITSIGSKAFKNCINLRTMTNHD